MKYAKPLLFSSCYLVAISLLPACSSNQPAFSLAAPTVGGPHYGNSNAGSLVYVSDGFSKIRMYAFPSLRRSGIIKSQALPGGECADSAGHVFVITRAGISQSSTISEYLAGGKKAVAMLSDPGSAFGCAIDPVSGDLAVTNFYDESNPYNTQGDVAVYQDAQGQPSMFYSSVTTNFFWCTYDGQSNLYVIAEQSRNEASLIRLSSGSATFEPITLPVHLYEGQGFWPTVQWDGQELAVTSNLKQQGRNGAGAMALYQLNISGSSGTVIGKTRLNAPENRFRGETWIFGNTIGAMYYTHGAGNMGFWHYPQGGQRVHAVKGLNTREGDLFGLAISST